MVVRGVGVGAVFETFATGAGRAGAAVMGPDGACARATSAASRPSAANPVNAASLIKQMAFMFDPEFARLSLYGFPKREQRVPFLGRRKILIRLADFR
jgi:hypothetical protein